jgi:O-antigen ligase
LPLDSFPIDAADLLLALIIAAWLAQGLARREITLPKAPLTVPMALLAGAMTVSLLAASSWREGLPEVAKWLQVLLLYLAVVAILPPQRIGWLIAGLLTAGVLQALLGIYQFMTQSGPEPFILLGRFMRAYGTFRQPNPYAGYLGLVAPLAISLAIWAWTAPRPVASMIRPSLWLRLALPLAAAVISLGLLLSWSRGGWIAFALSVLAILLALSRRSAPTLIVAGGVVLALALVLGLSDLLPAPVVDRLAELQGYLGMVDVRQVEVTDANFSVVERVAHWEAALAMWADHPWLGVGAGNYAVVYENYALPRWYEPLGHAHNVYLNFAAEAGLLGLLAYLGLWLAMGWQAVRTTVTSDRFVAALGAGVLGVLVHATVHNLFDNLWVQHMYLQLSLIMGMLAVASGNKMTMGHG